MASYNYTFTSGDTVTPTKLNSARTVSEIVNADIKSDAAIAGTKIAPALGAQDITVSGGARSITNTSDFALIFGTNNTERVRINNLGNMGIGTLADIGAKLDVRAGTLRLSTNNDRTTVYGINRGDTGSTNGMASIGMFGSGANGYQGNIIFSTSGSDVFNASLTERMRINASGNVGVATTADTFRLHAYHATADCVVTSQGRATSLGGSGKASVQIDVDGTGGFALQTDSTSGTRLFRLISNSGYGLGETTALAVTSGGNVGIGTTSPTKRLTVVGPTANGAGNEALWVDANTVQFAVRRESGGGGTVEIGTPNNHNLGIFTNGTTVMSIGVGGTVAIGTASPSAAALLDVSSTTKGFLPPRMTTAQRDAISTPPAGLVIYNTSTNVLNFYNGSAWAAV
jgi:hypothetical protein